MFEDDSESFGLANGLLFVSFSFSLDIDQWRVTDLDLSLSPNRRKSSSALYLNSSLSVSTSMNVTFKITLHPLTPTLARTRSRSTRNGNLTKRRKSPRNRIQMIPTATRMDWEVKMILRNSHLREIARGIMGWMKIILEQVQRRRERGRKELLLRLERMPLGMRWGPTMEWVIRVMERLWQELREETGRIRTTTVSMEEDRRRTIPTLRQLLLEEETASLNRGEEVEAILTPMRDSMKVRLRTRIPNLLALELDKTRQ